MKKLSRKGGGNNLDDQYYKGLDLKDKEIGFYRAEKDSSQGEGGPGDNGLNHNESEKETANTCNTVAKKTRHHFSKAHRSILETTYHHNPKLNRTAQAGIAKELGLERGHIYVSLFSKASFPYILTATTL